MALSPNRCAKVFFGSEHEPKLSLLQPDLRDLEVENFCTSFLLNEAPALY